MKSIFAAITNASVRFRWVTVIFVALCLAGGVYSASKMRQELLPPIDFPQVFIFSIQPGASSEDLRDLVSIPLEQAVTAIPGVIKDGLQSTTASPVAFLSVAYEYGLNGTAIQNQIQAAINSVVSAGVPKGLKTTADLTPAIVTQVLKRAPSMWAHFDSAQLLALPPDVLDAALNVSPDFAAQLDPLTRDQLAAERVNQKLTGQATPHRPVPLPGAWMVTNTTLPSIKTFSLNSLPVIIASVAAKSSDLTSDQLRALVNSQIVDPLTKQHTIPGVADVSVSGGQQIPADVAQEAVSAVARTQAQQTNPANNANNSNAGANPAAPTPVPTASPANAAQATPNAPIVSQTDANGVPLLPTSWKGFFAIPLLNSVLHVQLDTAADLLKTKDNAGATQTAAAALNTLASKHDGNFIRDLSPTVLAYLQTNEPGFVDNLSAGALAALSEDAYVALKGGPPAPPLGDAWTLLLQQPAFQDAPVPLATVRDLLAMPGGAAGTINSIVANTPALLQSFAVRIVSSLTPDAITYLNAHENGFVGKLSSAVLRDLSSDALKALPSGFIDGLSDTQLKTDLKAIIADPSKAAAVSLTNSGAANAVPDDPTAPKLPDSWPKTLAPRGIKAVKADDLLRHPSGQPTAAAFLNLLANFGASGLIADLTPDVLTYLQAHEPTFYATLQPTTLGMLSKATLDKLPPDVVGRATSSTVFTPTSSVTRVNSQSSFILSVTKDDTANTVEVSDAVQALFAQLQKSNPQLTISVPFEQAGFIKDSISGVAREGVLGAIMAVLVILLFLNFSFRSTLVTAVSIPTSVAIAFVLMYELPRRVHPLLAQLPDGAITTVLLRLFPANITLNIMTLSGLTVAIGRVVDDSIVVLENIYRQVQTGVPAKEAVLRGTRDVSLAIFAATVTTVVVFLPIGLSGGIIGEVFLPFGLAVTYALAASFVVAITIVPLLAYWFVKQPKVVEEKEGRLQAAYHRVIVWALDHRWGVLGLAALSLVIGMVLFATRPTTFLPAFGQPQITASVSMPPGTPLAQTDVYTQQFESYLHTLIGSGDKGIDKYQTTVGSSGGFASFVSSGVSGNSAQISIAPTSQDADTLAALTLQIRAKAESIFGKSNVKVSKATLTDQGFGGFALVISGSEAELKQVNDSVIKALDAVPGLINVTSTLSQVAGAGTTYLRVAGQPAVQFSAELETQDTLGVTAKAIAAIKAMPGLPKDLNVGEGFQSQQQTQGFSQTFGSLGLAILIVYLVMVFTFGSPVHPFTILFSLPLAVVGAAAALAITNRVLGISALIGLLMLVGIVVTNAIVLVDRVQANRKERHLPVREALIEGGRTRLRPILMTALATMIALLPLASGLSEGAIIASELGTVVIGGLFSSTILTLVVVPVVYSLLDQAQRTILRRPAEQTDAAPIKAASGD
ncbi:MAG: efflux RND transporter permease subunit [Aggregatilineales bacterium]